MSDQPETLKNYDSIQKKNQIKSINLYFFINPFWSKPS